VAKEKSKKKKSGEKEKVGKKRFPLPGKVGRRISSFLFFLLSIIVLFSFFGMSGIAGNWLRESLIWLVGATFYLLPLVFALMGLAFFKTRYKKFLVSVFLGFFLLVFGISGAFQILSEKNDGFNLSGGLIGRIGGAPLVGLFDIWISLAIMACAIAVGLLVFKQLFYVPEREKREKESIISHFKKTIGRHPSLESISLESEEKKEVSAAGKYEEPAKQEIKPKISEKKESQIHNFPPADLLGSDRGTPNSGDTKINSAIIKKTLENFDIPVEMSEISIGPTVTQYTLKPSEGIKLSRITSLANDLSLALAAHPIRLEAPIPGRSLVGVEIPNKIRAEIRMRSLVESSSFRDSSSKLPLVLGRDVSGMPQYAALEKMPHLLVAGATGTGKTIFLNALILSLLYKNSPDDIRLILVDPKRVEFTNYSEIPHLLTPVIFDINRTCNALKWLAGEMERRLGLLSEAKA